MLVYVKNAAFAAATGAAVDSPIIDLGADFKNLGFVAEFAGLASTGASVELQESATGAGAWTAMKKDILGDDTREPTLATGVTSMKVAGRNTKRYVKAVFTNGSNNAQVAATLLLGAHFRR
jgi:hypothetical protein